MHLAMYQILYRTPADPVISPAVLVSLVGTREIMVVSGVKPLSQLAHDHFNTLCDSAFSDIKPGQMYHQYCHWNQSAPAEFKPSPINMTRTSSMSVRVNSAAVSGSGGINVWLLLYPCIVLSVSATINKSGQALLQTQRSLSVLVRELQ